MDFYFVGMDGVGNEAQNQLGCILHLLGAQARPTDLVPKVLLAEKVGLCCLA